MPPPNSLCSTGHKCPRGDLDLEGTGGPLLREAPVSCPMPHVALASCPRTLLGGTQEGDLGLQSRSEPH